MLEAVPPVGARIRVVRYAWLDARGLDRPQLLLRVDGSRGTALARYDRWVDALIDRAERERE